MYSEAENIDYKTEIDTWNEYVYSEDKIFHLKQKSALEMKNNRSPTEITLYC